MKLANTLKAVLVAAPLCFGAGAAKASVMELAIVLDGSGSISPSDFLLQTGAYESVFQDDFYDTFIAPSPFDSLAVSAYQFSNTVTQEIGWTAITDNTTASTFGGLFAGISQQGGTTNTSAAIDTAVAGILDNAFDGDKLVIDISTDGVPTNSSGFATATARAAAIDAADAARAEEIIVNALGVGGVDTTFLADLVDPTGFFETADNFGEFEQTLRTKIGRETQDVPVPATFVLFVIGLAGLVAGRRRNGS